MFTRRRAHFKNTLWTRTRKIRPILTCLDVLCAVLQCYWYGLAFGISSLVGKRVGLRCCIPNKGIFPFKVSAQRKTRPVWKTLRGCGTSKVRRWQRIVFKKNHRWHYGHLKLSNFKLFNNRPPIITMEGQLFNYSTFYFNIKQTAGLICRDIAWD